MNRLTDRQASIIGWVLSAVIGMTWLWALNRWPWHTLEATGLYGASVAVVAWFDTRGRRR